MKQESSTNGIGMTGALFLIFLVLKLCRVIDWSWWWVTSPVWIPLFLAIVGLLLLGAIAIYHRQSRPNETARSE